MGKLDSGGPQAPRYPLPQHDELVARRKVARVSGRRPRVVTAMRTPHSQARGHVQSPRSLCQHRPTFPCPKVICPKVPSTRESGTRLD